MSDPYLGRRLIAEARLTRDERRIELAIRKALSRHKAHAMATVRQTMVTAAAHPDAFNLVTWDTSVETDVLPVISDVMTDLAFSATQFLRSSPDLRSRILGQIDVTTRAGNLADKVKGMGPDLAQRVTDELPVGAAKGEGSQALADRLDFVFDDIGENQAARIARTETHGASEAMSHDSATAVAQAGLEVTKTWIATADERTRPDHADADGDQVPIDQPFSVGGEDLMFPGDPDGSAENVINCRCSCTYDMPSEADMPSEEE